MSILCNIHINFFSGVSATLLTKRFAHLIKMRYAKPTSASSAIKRGARSAAKSTGPSPNPTLRRFARTVMKRTVRGYGLKMVMAPRSGRRIPLGALILRRLIVSKSRSRRIGRSPMRIADGKTTMTATRFLTRNVTM